MTRENKLALVVGFGLILLVGILVSDHFSAARNQEPAELSQALDPLSATRANDPELIALRAETPSSPEVDAASGDIDRDDARNHRPPRPEDGYQSAAPVIPEPIEGIEMGGRPQAGIGPSPDEAARLPYTFHHVRKGEYLSTICQEHYGDATLAAALASYNDLDDPDALKTGQRLRVPKADGLLGGVAPPMGTLALDPTGPAASGGTRSPREAAQPPAKHASYTVKSGDVLTEIASRLLGSAKRYTAIYEANRDQLDSPDDIRVGMTLRIPR